MERSFTEKGALAREDALQKYQRFPGRLDALHSKPERSVQVIAGDAIKRHKLKRTAFTTSRLAEYCPKKELVAQTGHEVELWPLVILKELLDNALDACEDASIAPVVSIVVEDDGRIIVEDNGPGLPPGVVASIVDFNTRTSSRE